MATEPNPHSKRVRGRQEVPALLRRERVNARIGQWLLDWLAERPESAGELIEDALMYRHKLKAPKV